MGEPAPRGDRRTASSASSTSRRAVGRPQVAYRETVSRGQPNKVEGPLRPPDRRLGPVRHRLHQPRGPRPGEGFDFVNKIKGGLGAVGVHTGPSRRASREALETGVQGGAIRWSDVPRDAGRRQSTTTPDSSEDRVQDRRIARAQGGPRSAPKPVLLRADHGGRGSSRPRTFLGDVIGDLSRRARPRRGPGAGAAKRPLAVKASVPLSEMFRVRHRSPVNHSGPCHIHDAVRPVRGGPRTASPSRSSEEEAPPAEPVGGNGFKAVCFTGSPLVRTRHNLRKGANHRWRRRSSRRDKPHVQRRHHRSHRPWQRRR